MENGLNRVGPAMALLAVAVISFAMGGILDSVRDLCENLVDNTTSWKVNWNFIFKFGEMSLQRMEDYYFTYYVFSTNIALGFPIGLLIAWGLNILPLLSHSFWCVTAVGWLVNVADAYSLRREIIGISKRNDEDITK